VKQFRILALVAMTVLAASVRADCQDVRILKKFVGVPESCEFSLGCEIWKSSAVLGPGEWHLGVNWEDLAWVATQPFGIPYQAYYGTATDTFVAKNGDELYAMNVTTSNVNHPTGAGIMHVNGGTGRFANVSGALFIRVDNSVGRAWVNGELCGLPDEYNDFDSGDED
jgi:hypothetical protein